jgi:hypothetical protein
MLIYSAMARLSGWLSNPETLLRLEKLASRLSSV